MILHDGLMYVSLVLVAGHLYLTLIHPATRHSLRGMTLGNVRGRVGGPAPREVASREGVRDAIARTRR